MSCGPNRRSSLLHEKSVGGRHEMVNSFRVFEPGTDGLLLLQDRGGPATYGLTGTHRWVGLGARLTYCRLKSPFSIFPSGARRSRTSAEPLLNFAS
jgi:hypothetical protein